MKKEKITETQRIPLWTCEVCGAENIERNRDCLRCQNPREERQASESREVPDEARALARQIFRMHKTVFSGDDEDQAASLIHQYAESRQPTEKAFFELLRIAPVSFDIKAGVYHTSDAAFVPIPDVLLAFFRRSLQVDKERADV